MNEAKRRKLESQGWKVGSADDFLELTEQESSYLDLRMSLSKAVRTLRQKNQLTQTQLAELMRSSQSRVAKAEAGDESVSLDLLIRSLLVMGASKGDLAKWIVQAA